MNLVENACGKQEAERKNDKCCDKTATQVRNALYYLLQQRSYPKLYPLQSSEDSLQFLCRHKPYDIVTTVSAPHTQKVLQIKGKKGWKNGQE